MFIAEFTSATHLQFKYWPGMLPFIAFAAGIGIFNVVRLRCHPILGAVIVILVAAWAICGEEAAFHTGEMANRWATAGIFPLALVGVLSLIAYFGRRRLKPKYSKPT